jgi:hypothetical protein
MMASGKEDENPINEIIVEPLPRQEPLKTERKGASSPNQCTEGFPLLTAIKEANHSNGVDFSMDPTTGPPGTAADLSLIL